MAKVFLEAGRRISLNGAHMRVGASGTVVDAVALADIYENDPTKPYGYGHGFGTICIDQEIDGVIEGVTYDVYLDMDSGKFWYDDEGGH
nr:hypothetical protein [uncultured Pseudomonas sp.]